MSNDVFYGADCQLRIGVMADKSTLPDDWYHVEFNRATVSVQTTKVRRPRLGAARENVLDPLRPREGIRRVTMDIVIDGDSLMLPRWLRMMLGAPDTVDPDTGLYNHTWTSGSKDEIYFAAAFRIGTQDVVLVRGASLSAISTDWGGDNSQDFDIQLTCMALDRTLEEGWPTGDVTNVTTPAPILRASARFNGTAVDQLPSGGFTWDRNLQADFYAVTGAANKVASYLRPGPEPSHSGRATLRSYGSTYDAFADAGTEFSAELRYLGVSAGHEIQFAHYLANMNDIPHDIGTGVIERALAWSAHQDSETPACILTIINNVASYA